MFEQLSERLGAIFARLSGRGPPQRKRRQRGAARSSRRAARGRRFAWPRPRRSSLESKSRPSARTCSSRSRRRRRSSRSSHDELVALLGGAQARLQFSDAPPSVIMLVGLQGSGKTTQAGKLALRLKEQGRRTLLVAADVYRPAAIDAAANARQANRSAGLRTRRRRSGKIARDGVAEAKRLGISTVIIDTAGRLQIDDDLMVELERIKAGGRSERNLVRRRCDDRTRSHQRRARASTIASASRA